MNRTLFMNIIKFEIPQEYENRDNVIICHNCHGLMAFIFGMLCINFAVMFVGLGIGTFIDYSGQELLGMLIFFLSFSAAFLFGIWMLVRYVKNTCVIFHLDGIWHRDWAGRVREIRNDGILGYSILGWGRRESLAIITAYGRIGIGKSSSGYYAAKQWVQWKYKEM